MKMTIVGGGNIGTLLAAEMAKKGHSVTVYTSKPQKWVNNIEVFDKNDKFLFCGKIQKITSDMQEAMTNADIIWVTMPSYLFTRLALQMEMYLSDGQYVGIIPGTGGAEFSFQPLVKKGCHLFGVQRVPAIARVKEYGQSVYMLGKKDKINVGVIGKDEKISDLLEEIFEISCIKLPNYLSVTLTPSNPLLHTTRLYSMFRNYSDGEKYERNYGFYREWDDESSKLLLKCDEELQQLCRIIPMNLKNVVSLKEHYESETVEEMTKKICSIEAFHNIDSPMKKEKGGWIPDFESRYFKADFAYGLKIIVDIARLFEVDVPCMNRIWNWYTNTVNESEFFRLNSSKLDFLKYYE
ncbi:MAG: NAD/NADP octopine/nopaline dehydrogenase family protein [Lachnospiraceae bacterium]